MFVRFTHKLASTVAATVASGLFLNLATADQYISIILTGNMFKDIYKKNGYESRLVKPNNGRCRHGDQSADSLEHMRNDAGHDTECAYTGVSAV